MESGIVSGIFDRVYTRRVFLDRISGFTGFTRVEFFLTGFQDLQDGEGFQNPVNPEILSKMHTRRTYFHHPAYL